ncbi:hypothetical protein FNV43_RR21513 [Rhamnella rubrinervis]|uniref:Uncharacterized protein n=1 Tax=Rhamnella rubrinervis TaxID=2594499 RepID=A0A8K0E2U7_9ROSA|nr:hypothetical protein FNV43_RR21513 [Rhamnella rubrinervis]
MIGRADMKDQKQRRYERLGCHKRLSTVRSDSPCTGYGRRGEGPAFRSVPARGDQLAGRLRRSAGGRRVGAGTRARPPSQSFSRFGSILPTSLAYIVPSTVHSPWNDAVMSAAGRGGHSVLRIFKGAAPDTAASRCSSGRWTLPPVSRFEWAVLSEKDNSSRPGRLGLLALPSAFRRLEF